ncbi:sodium transporter [Pelomyxa schiedti]|nr:sodium transporter [Pelomyxa schiedti]
MSVTGGVSGSGSGSSDSASGGGNHLAVLDFVAIGVYFLVLGCIAFFASRRRGTDPTTFFLAGRGIPWFAVGASLFSSNIGAEHFLGLAGSGAKSGIAAAGFELLAGGLLLLVLGWFFLPVYQIAKVCTMPEYLQRRFESSKIKFYLSGLSMLIYIFTKTSVALYSGGIVLKEIGGWNPYISALVLIVGTGAYSVMGGLNAVIYTELFQTVTLVIGGLVLMSIAFWEVGGMSGLMNNYGIPESYFHLLQPASDPDYPWPGMVFCIYAGSLWYWCADQVMVQRALSAKNLDHGRAGTVSAAFLKILPLFMMSFVGVIAYALYPEEVSERVDIAYPLMVVRLLPNGLRGVMVSSMLAALMSSLASVFNSCSTLFTLDLWKHARPKASERELVTVGRIATIFIIGTSFAWLPLLTTSTDQLFVYIQSVSNYLAPPITAVFLAAVFTTRVSEKTAIAALGVGLFIGLCRFILELVFGYYDIHCLFTDVNYLYFGMFLAIVCGVVIVIGSILQCRAPATELPGLTWWTRKATPPPATSPAVTEPGTKEPEIATEVVLTDSTALTGEEEVPLPTPPSMVKRTSLDDQSRNLLNTLEVEPLDSNAFVRFKKDFSHKIKHLTKLKILLLVSSVLYCAAITVIYIIFD